MKLVGHVLRLEEGESVHIVSREQAITVTSQSKGDCAEYPGFMDVVTGDFAHLVTGAEAGKYHLCDAR